MIGARILWLSFFFFGLFNHSSPFLFFFFFFLSSRVSLLYTLPVPAQPRNLNDQFMRRNRIRPTRGIRYDREILCRGNNSTGWNCWPMKRKSIELFSIRSSMLQSYTFHSISVSRALAPSVSIISFSPLRSSLFHRLQSPNPTGRRLQVPTSAKILAYRFLERELENSKKSASGMHTAVISSADYHRSLVI